MKTTEYISSRILKYQNPPNGIQRRDAIKDYTPQTPFGKVKRVYTPIQQPVLSQDNRNRWQHEQASKQADRGYNDYMEAKKTQEGLNNLNGFLNFTDVMGLGTGIAALLGKGVKSAGKQAIKRVTRNKMQKELGEDYTNRLIKALGDRKDSRPNTAMKFGNMTAEFANYLKQQGVDISKFTDKDLINLMSLRNESVNSNLPLSGRFALISDRKNNGVLYYQSDLYSGRDNKIGYLYGESTGNDLKVGSLAKENLSTNKEKGISEDLYNSVIQYAKQKGYNGVRSGDLLQSPEITYKVWNKFPNKELIGTFGEHKFNFGKTVRNPENRVKTILDGNVYRLTTPTKFIPTKNEWMFHPSLADKNTGKLSPPNWNDKDIYKIIIPTGVSFNSLNSKPNEE